MTFTLRLYGVMLFKVRLRAPTVDHECGALLTRGAIRIVDNLPRSRNLFPVGSFMGSCMPLAVALTGHQVQPTLIPIRMALATVVASMAPSHRVRVTSTLCAHARWW